MNTKSDGRGAWLGRIAGCPPRTSPRWLQVWSPFDNLFVVSRRTTFETVAFNMWYQSWVIMRPEEGSETTPFLELKNMMNQRDRRAFIRAGLIAGVSTFAGASLLRAAEEKKPGEEESHPARI